MALSLFFCGSTTPFHLYTLGVWGMIDDDDDDELTEGPLRPSEPLLS